MGGGAMGGAMGGGVATGPVPIQVIPLTRDNITDFEWEFDGRSWPCDIDSFFRQSFHRVNWQSGEVDFVCGTVLNTDKADIVNCENRIVEQTFTHSTGPNSGCYGDIQAVDMKGDVVVTTGRNSWVNVFSRQQDARTNIYKGQAKCSWCAVAIFDYAAPQFAILDYHDGNVHIVDVATNKMASKMTKVFAGFYGKYLIADPYNPAMFLAAEESGTSVSYVDARTAKRAKVIGGWGKLGNCMQFATGNPNKFLIVDEEDNSVKVYDIATGKLFHHKSVEGKKFTYAAMHANVLLGIDDAGWEGHAHFYDINDATSVDSLHELFPVRVGPVDMSATRVITSDYKSMIRKVVPPRV